jgi:hypothetical protein
MHRLKKYEMYYGMIIHTGNGQVHLPKVLMQKPIIGKKEVRYYSCYQVVGGIVSTVVSNKENEFMSFKHLGLLKNGVEDTESESVKRWAGAVENYRLIDEGGKTKLVVDMDITDEFKDYFVKTWPVALEKVKELSEKI